MCYVNVLWNIDWNLDWLQIIHDVLPHKAKTIMDRLIMTSQDAVIKLEGEPASTIDYVNLLKWVLVYTIWFSN